MTPVKSLKFLSILVVASFLFTLLTCCDVYAKNNLTLFKSPYLSQDFSLTRQVGEPITLQEIGWKSWGEISRKEKLTKEKLIKLSVRLRDIARSLGSMWSIVISISANQQINPSIYGITDLKKFDGTWTSMTAGYALSLATLEIETLESSKGQPLVDFLVKDDLNDIYRPLLQVPLDSYCRLLLNLFKI